MKHLIGILAAFCFAAWAQAAVPTPAMAMSFEFLKKDPRNWTPAHQDGNELGIIMELVPKGDDVAGWKELVVHQIAFTDASVRKFVDVWKGGLTNAAPEAECKEDVAKDGSILVTYTAVKADEVGMRKFIKGPDGIYMLAYNVRPKLKDEKRIKLWNEILGEASLSPNPNKTQKQRPKRKE
jgi:hypothetical protein